ncbi:MAG TPA: proline dehydrogenase family protein, partial [Desulfurivibrionaceae bacterium]|nr:proline dehydrogenase family protein [Desulfurivibrionaceae bacterium]
MRDEQFKAGLFRFVDVFPVLKSGDQVMRHIREYFGDGADLPPVLTTGLKAAEMLGSLGASMLGKAVSTNIREMGRQFIIAETTDEAVRNLGKLRREGYAFAVDLLGEATLSHAEGDRYVETYCTLIAALHNASAHWEPLPPGSGATGPDWGGSPAINVAVKPSSLYCLADPRDFEGSVAGILQRLKPIVAAVRDVDGFLCIDMESTRMKGITLEVYRRLKQEYPDYHQLGIAMQSYLRDTDEDLAELLAWAEREQVMISVRLVKGAYWDYEVVKARQNGWEAPVWTIKAQSDAAFERHARLILQHHQQCHFACASHNVRSIAAVLEHARDLGVPEERYEFQVLYGMAEPVRRALLREVGRVRLYAPYGELVPGMGYLVRRLLENTANESFLRRTFTGEEELDRLLEDPVVTASREKERRLVPVVSAPSGVFRNEPSADFTRPELRHAFVANLEGVRARSGELVLLHINGADLRTVDIVPSVNPAFPEQVVGMVCQAGIEEASAALAAAREAFPAWRDTPAGERAACLVKAAALARQKIVELAAWQVVEIGKPWDQAYADVAEAIDFLEFYAREMLRLAEPRRLGDVPAEINTLRYEPCGVAAVIAPWNFPLAISCGMTAAALVAGNTVVYKPSGLTPVIGRQLAELFIAAGIPAGVFNYLPGLSAVIGDYLVDHPDVRIIAFTGSVDVGLRIAERAGRRSEGQTALKRVICEMGGKNAAIVDDDADLDEAITNLLQSAFGFQGQKCSACSRIIVLDSMYQQFVDRFVSAASALTIRPAEDPAFALGPVADAEQQRKILEYIDIGAREGTVLYRSRVPEGGYYVPLVILGDILPEHRVAQEEIFGPVLSLMRARDFTDALRIANSTRYALTGSVFSRSPANLERASREFRVGNLYLNRGCTGAMVERQPFGGFLLSGGGTKAGGTDYLQHFMTSRIVTENTMRRGFAPSDI